MDKLVFMDNDQIVTSSRNIARDFGKEHRNVMRDIEGVLKNEQAHGMFYKTTYIHEQNKQEYPMYLMNRDGFTLLVMGFTGNKAMEFKLKYIDAFNKMEQFMNSPEMIVQRAMEIQQRKVLELEQTIEQQKPLVNFAETCMTSEHSLLVREVAKLASKQGVKTGEQRLWKKLREWGLVFKDKNEPYQEFVERDYFEITQGVKETKKGAFTWVTMRVKPKGQAYIINRLKKELA